MGAAERIGFATILLDVVARLDARDDLLRNFALYMHGRQRQYAVRVFGVTGRTRVLRYDAKTRKWIG